MHWFFCRIVSILFILNFLGVSAQDSLLVSSKRNFIISAAEKPIARINQVDLRFTSKGLFKSQLKAGQLLDYTHLSFPYYYFPDHIHLDILDDKGTYNTVVSDQAVFYKEFELIELKGNVVLTLADGTVLKTSELFWDQSLEWLYTDAPYTILSDNGSQNKGIGFDTNQALTKFTSRTNNAVGINL